MIERRAAPDRAAIPPPFRNAALAGIILVAGFLLLQTAPVVSAFHAVAELLAICATVLLRILGYPILRTGIEIRDSLTDHAIAVTEACDGSSLLIGAIALTALLWQSGRHDMTQLIASTLIAIFVFNLLRVLLLFVSIGAPSLLAIQHLYLAPLLSAVLVAGLVLAGLRLPLRQLIASPLLWIAVAVIAAGLWYFLADAVTCATAVPIANTLLWLFPGELERAIVCRASDAIIATAAVVGQNPVRVLEVPFHPSDFTLALPLVLGSLALQRRPAVIGWGVVATLALFSLAMALGAMTASSDAANARGVVLLMGVNFSAPYQPIGEIGLALLKSLQNALVHFDLFLLPLALLLFAASLSKRPLRPAPRAPGPEPGRRRR